MSKRTVLIICAILSGIVPTSMKAAELFGHAVPEVRDTLTSDTTISGVAFFGALAPSAPMVLTMTDADTLILLGDADFSQVTLSDSSQGTIVLAHSPDSGSQVNTLTLTVQGTHLNHLIMARSGSQTPTMNIYGDSLTLQGDLERRGEITSYFGTDAAPLAMWVKGNFDMGSESSRTNLRGHYRFGGDVYAKVWWAYHGFGSSLLEFVGDSDQQVFISDRFGADIPSESRNHRYLHTGTGILRLAENLVEGASFVQTAGTLDLGAHVLAADSIVLGGALENTAGLEDNGVPKSRIFARRHLQLHGLDSATGDFAPDAPWGVSSNGILMAYKVELGNSMNLSQATEGIAIESDSATGKPNSGWRFVDKPAFSKALVDTIRTRLADTVAFLAIPVFPPEAIATTIAWDTNGTNTGTTGMQFLLTTAAEKELDSTWVHVYLLQGTDTLDRDSAIILVDKSPRLKTFDPKYNQKIGGFDRAGYFDGGELQLRVDPLAGVDSVAWFQVVGSDTSALQASGTFGENLTIDSLGMDWDSTYVFAIAYGDSGTTPDTALSGYRNEKTMIRVHYPLVIHSQPTGKTVSVGETVEFSVSASSSAPISYQWYRREGNKNVALGGKTDSVLSITVTSEDSLALSSASFRYLVEITYGEKTKESNIAELNLQPPVGLLPRISGALLQAYPNPFRAGAWIPFQMAEAGSAIITVHDLSGKQVKELLSERLQPGTHQVYWDRFDDKSLLVPAGRYLVRIRLPSTSGQMIITAF